MLRDTLFIARKDLKYTLRARETILWVFIMPIVFFFFIGNITSGFSPDGAGEVLAVRAQSEPGFLVDELTRRLEERDYTVVGPESEEEFMTHSRRLRVPAGFTESVMAGEPTTVEFAYADNGLGGDYQKIRVQRAIYTVLADLVVVKELDNTPTPAGFARLAGMPRALTLEVRPAGERKQIPSGFAQAIPGIMVMFTLLVMATSGAILLVIERREGLLRRLAYTPINRLDVVLGKWGGKWAVGVVQIAFAMVAGTVLFGMDWGPDFGTVVVLMLVYGAMMAAVGVLLGSLARTEGQAIGIGVVTANVLAALGGCWWPVEVAPPWMQKLQLFIPTGWAMNGLHKLVSFGAGPASVLPHIAGMALATIILIAASKKVFRFE